jgi:hypothetical protein
MKDTLSILNHIVNMKNVIMLSTSVLCCKNGGAWCPGVSLPAPSLRGPSASLRTFPEDFGSRISKHLISQVFSTVKPVLSSVKSIFLPAPREDECLSGLVFFCWRP